MVSYSDETDYILDLFPRIPEAEDSLLIDHLSVIFLYDAEKRPGDEDLISHPWFHPSANSAQR
jgi:hypothetical protein